MPQVKYHQGGDKGEDNECNAKSENLKLSFEGTDLETDTQCSCIRVGRNLDIVVGFEPQQRQVCSFTHVWN